MADNLSFSISMLINFIVYVNCGKMFPFGFLIWKVLLYTLSSVVIAFLFLAVVYFTKYVPRAKWKKRDAKLYIRDRELNAR